MTRSSPPEARAVAPPTDQSLHTPRPPGSAHRRSAAISSAVRSPSFHDQVVGRRRERPRAQASAAVTMTVRIVFLDKPFGYYILLTNDRLDAIARAPVIG